MTPQEYQPIFNIDNIEKFKALYTTFDTSTIHKLPDLYSQQITFKDPIHQLEGLASLKNYFSNFCESEMQCNFIFTNHIVGEGQAFFQWIMYYSHPRLRGGEKLTLHGGTLIKFNSSIYYHEDFYDMGAMVYQHIPVVGWIVKKINERLVSTT